ncbi:hypothetical protein ABFS82_06G185600 [Erythranthe guttata]|uniref:Uncharacterized protein n=1 Tax=Erythranthe guttata TaxID=4155 RepID=A0A022RL68_ERYGU|nr:PREDICTED: uncharacterized protein LOC105955406 [Erythranthe guttata]EYU39650.1 hypothetical protein MIMGU_mgv1a012648mg [Erythranthe guttata]|eukprot:XP_012834575.1 PREDICTED: uncharacterized protein LOC105955406 [Erythranthe guttata]
MEDQCSPLSWAYYYQEEGVEELKQSLFYSTLELESAVLAAHEEISRKDDEILQLNNLIAKIIKERDEFEAKCQNLVVEKQLLSQQVQIHNLEYCCPNNYSSGSITSNNDNIALSPSDCDDTLPPTAPRMILDVADGITLKRPLPENGKFLQAVMEAGPLLQTLLLAGPLPRWQHPPPKLNSGDIPPVTISSPAAAAAKILHHQDSCRLVSPSGGFTNKRAMVNMDKDLDFSPISKFQKVCSPIN